MDGTEGQGQERREGWQVGQFFVEWEWERSALRAERGETNELRRAHGFLSDCLPSTRPSPLGGGWG